MRGRKVTTRGDGAESCHQRRRNYWSFMLCSMMSMPCSRLVCKLISLSLSLSLFLFPSPLISVCIYMIIHVLCSLYITHTHTISRLSVLVKYHKLYAVNMKAICDLIRKIKEYRVMLSSTTAQDEWVSLFIYCTLGGGGFPSLTCPLNFSCALMCVKMCGTEKAVIC